MDLLDQVEAVIEFAFQEVGLRSKIHLTFPFYVEDIKCQFTDVEIGSQREVEHFEQGRFRHVGVDRLRDFQQGVQFQLLAIQLLL